MLISAKAHLRQAVIGLEEAIRIHSLSKQLRRIDTFHDILRMAHDRYVQKVRGHMLGWHMAGTCIGQGVRGHDGI